MSGNTQQIVKKDVTLGYVEKDWEVHIKAEQDIAKPTRDWKDVTQWFTGLTLLGAWKRNFRETYAVEVNIKIMQVEYDPSTKVLGDISGLVEYNQNEKNGLKVKFNDKLWLTAVLKRVFNSQFAASLGLSVPLAGSGKREAQVGVQI